MSSVITDPANDKFIRMVEANLISTTSALIIWTDIGTKTIYNSIIIHEMSRLKI